MHRIINVYNNIMEYKHTGDKGFTLVEMMVSVALFVIVMTISVGSLLSIIDADAKAQNMQTAVSNLNTSIDGMVRELRMGSKYEGSNNNKTISYIPFGKTESDRSKYELKTDPVTHYNYINHHYKPNGGSSFKDMRLTSSDVNIKYFGFFVTGDDPNDNIQPRVFVIMRGEVDSEKLKNKQSFSVQATATQRLLDI